MSAAQKRSTRVTDGGVAARMGLPAVEPWFYGIGSLDEAITTHPDAEAIYSFDADSGNKGAKLYHPSPSRAAFMAALMALPDGQRHAYEVVRENEPCKCYWDVEYYSTAVSEAQLAEARADNAALIRCATESILAAAAAEALGGVAQHSVVVLDGSRPTTITAAEARKTGLATAAAGGEDVACHKFSFHIVLCSVAFESNTCPALRAFVNRALPRLSTLAAQLRLKWRPTDATETAPDQKVYGRRQNFRMIGCSKRGTGGVELRVVVAGGVGPLAACLTHIEPGLPSVAAEAATTAAANPSRKRRRVGDGDSVKKGRLPFPIELLQELLVAGGDSVSEVSGARYIEDGDEWQAQCDQRKQARVCLINPTRTHDSNNCILFIKKDTTQRAFLVKYHCTGGECAKSRVKLLLGAVHFDQETLEWACCGRAAPDAAAPDETGAPAAPAAPAEPAEAAESECYSDDVFDPEDPDGNTYDAVKARVERTCFKVTNPFCYAKLPPQQPHGGEFRPQLFSTERLRQYFANVYFFETDSKDIMCKLLFINRWMGDVRIREVTRIVCDPQSADPKAYNMWNGFVAERLPPIASAAEVDALVAPIVHHIARVMTDDDPEHTGWVLDYLANILQRPHRKTQVAISLFGKQGCGKGILFDFFRTKILGHNCSKQTSNPMADLFGGFASGLVNSVLVQIDEITNLKDKKDSLKDLITSDKVRYEQKGKDCIVVQNLSNLVFTSNNESTLSIAADDRRFVLFKCSSVYMGNAPYFQSLANHLERPQVARALFQFLMARDLSRYPYHFQSLRPKTAYYKAAQLASIPVLMRFLSGVANTAVAGGDAAGSDVMIEKAGASVFYERYTRFYNAGNYKFKYILSLKAFAGAVEPIAAITKRRAGRGIVYHIDRAALKLHLQDSNEYDEDASLLVVASASA